MVNIKLNVPLCVVELAMVKYAYASCPTKRVTNVCDCIALMAEATIRRFVKVWVRDRGLNTIDAFIDEHYSILTETTQRMIRDHARQRLKELGMSK